MISHDAFYVSHSLESVAVPSQDEVDRFLPPYAPAQRLDTANPSGWGNVVTQEMYCRHRQEMQQAMEDALVAAQEADRAWGEITGRTWGLVERYRCDGAKAVVVAIGSMCGTAREAVDQLRAAGEAVGLVKLRLFRPFPQEALRIALAGVRDVIVLDRNHSPGLGGILHQEVRAALYGLDKLPRVHGMLAGVGGVNVPPQKIMKLVRDAVGRAPAPQSTWE
jgi:pyruvate/2-oxoacid:ferredoxin oxidoreductase alpha subunit